MKKKLLFSMIFSMLLWLNSCDILDQMGEIDRFAQCDFALTGVKVTEISGIDFSHISKASDLGVAEMMTLGQKLFSGKLPAKIQVDVRAKNNNAKTAGISGLVWKVFIEENELVGGQLNKSVQIAPQASVNFPVAVSVDLIDLLQQESLPKILNLVFGMKNASELRELGLSVKIKPTYKTQAGALREFPTWITIRP